MKKWCFLLLLCGIATAAAGQTYVDWLTKADQYYKEKAYAKAGAAYDSTILIHPEIHNVVYYNGACSWALAGESDKAIGLLDKAIEHGWIDLNWTLKDSDFNSLHDLPQWETTIAKLRKKLEAYEASLDKEVMAELAEIDVKDQYYRQMMDSVRQEFGPRSAEMRELWVLQNEADSLNLVRVKAIIKEHGYPGKTMAGNRYGSTAFMVIQHSDLATQEEYLPLLTEAAEKGELSKSSLALLIDRIRVRNDQPQIYGSQVRQNPETEKFEPFPIENPEEVDKRRAEMGLGPLADYLSRWGIEWE